ncbi:34230_t:CDS:1 [Gigaspora margarita]|uniref:34230_t:CDS:1 n=1 Tax=Gigaspora margarita TaxID=4874 RepID=A0ABN7VTE4_GIGMA|nr:34230_t:CDS:1 [Gigaspora margarita]
MNLKRTIEVLEEIRSMFQIVIQEEQAMRRGQTTKKAKKTHTEVVNLNNGHYEQLLESGQFGLNDTICTMTSKDLYTTTNEIQTTTNIEKSSGLSIKEPILEKSTTTNNVDIITNMGTNEETSTDIEIENSERKLQNLKKQQQELIELSMLDIDDSSTESTYPISKMIIDKPGPMIIETNNRTLKIKIKKNGGTDNI